MKKLKSNLRRLSLKIIKFFLFIFGVTSFWLRKERNDSNNLFIRVVNFHDLKFGDEKRFRRIIRYLSRYYDFISYSEFKSLNQKALDFAIKKPFMLLTFDDGLKGNYCPLLNILKEKRVPALFFVCSDLVGTKKYMDADEIQECINSGLVDIGCHTATHKKMTDNLSSHELEYEIVASKEKLEKLFNYKIDSFCFPFGEDDCYSSHAFWYVKKHYNYAFCTYSHEISPGSNLFLIPRTNIQVFWSKFEVLFQLTQKHDKRFIKKSDIVRKNYLESK